jgi:hypothetical protein
LGEDVVYSGKAKLWSRKGLERVLKVMMTEGGDLKGAGRGWLMSRHCGEPTTKRTTHDSYYLESVTKHMLLLLSITVMHISSPVLIVRS